MNKKTILMLIAILFIVNIGAYASEYSLQEHTADAGTTIQHVVEPGETFWTISVRFGISLDELIAANPQHPNPSNVWTGLVLNIPVRVVVPMPTSTPIPTMVPGFPSSEGRESLAFLFAGTTNTYIRAIDATNGSLRTICPDYFDIDANGNLLITPSDKIDPDFIDEMHSRGILITPFISSHWDRELAHTALDNRENLSTQVAEMIERYNLDGVNIDIENANHTYRDQFTDFARLLRQKLPSDKILSVAVAANPHGWTLGWHGSYDYKSLAENSDYLMLMTYDESYFGGPPGPVSSRWFFETSIHFALNQGVPRDKLLVGKPFFGRAWKQGEAVGGFGITANDVEFLIENYESSFRYDYATQSANVIVTIHPGEPEPRVWGGRVLTAGLYDIWYDDLRATRFKLDTINDLDLKGTGSWALGQEDQRVWDFYLEALNGTANAIPSPTPMPTEVPTTTSTPMISPTQPPVNTPMPTIQPTLTPNPTVAPTPTPVPISNTQRILNAVNGNGNTRAVNTRSVLTRGEVAVLLAEITNVTPEPEGATFEDTISNWGRGHINALKRRGILQSVDNNFRPNNPMMRGDLSIILDKIMVLPNTIDFHTIDFKDVPRGSVWHNSVARLYFFDIVHGHNKNFFRPEDGVTVEEMSMILNRIDSSNYYMNPDRVMSFTNGIEPIVDPR